MLTSKVRKQVEAAIEACGLEAHRTWLLKQIRSAVTLEARPGGAKTGVGSHRAGGYLDLPRGFEWPRWNGYPEPAHMAFVAQLELAKLPKSELELPSSDIEP